MRLDELQLFGAVHDVRLDMEAANENPGAEAWTTDELKRLELTRRIIFKLMDTCDQGVIDAWVSFDGIKKLQLLVEVSRVHGARCFYASRGLGDCSSDIDLDRLVPGTRGGKYSVQNCVIACSRHNRMKSDLSVEAFLLNGVAI